jgi:Gpi18-like mannosyltransferase
MKIGYQLIHTLCIMTVYLISHLYFRTHIKQVDVPKAQLIGFILLTNPWDRTFYTLMYNDQIMTLYILLCMYFTLANKPLLATFFFTLGLSVKAGVLLLLPAFLGQMQYNYGTVNLLKSIAIIIGF